ncbi:unnamed protein product [Rotaria socialis]|uniref:ADP ribosyltransferase domain-containing protein n=1 Tax=Rotaria socialis TaxID=392032 RepID=A0A821SQU3_9BILA|nr:unnamed protein product [Rotaria socialis]CAF4863702.1 unnamed protein product [Rotaria socialis]
MPTTITWDLTRSEASENREDFQLIWFGSKSYDTPSSHLIHNMLLDLNPTAQFYSDVSLCENFIKTTKNETLILIMSDEYANDYLKRMATVRAVRAVFIYSRKESNDRDYRAQHSKVINIFTSKHQLIKSIKMTIRLLEKQTCAFSLFKQNQKTAKDLSRESASFIWHQLLIHVLRQMMDDEHAKIDMLNKCTDYYRFNKTERKNIERFRLTYCPENAIRWYTEDSFVYKLLNKALRTENIELIYAFRYFIIDLCAELEHRRLKLNENETLLLYRGQQIPNEEFEKLQKNVGKLISPNGFLSTSRDKRISVTYAGKILNQMTAVLFEIEVDSSSQSVICADIENQTVFPQEREVLFSVGSTFKIDSIEFDKDMSLHVMRLKSVDASERVEEYLKLATDEMKDTSPMLYFGSLLLHELGQIEHAKKYFKVLLKTLPSDHPDIAGLYTGLGHVCMKKGEHQLALEKYMKAYEIRRDKLSILNPRIAASLRNIAHAHRSMGKNDQALEFLREARYINDRNYSNDHLDVAMTLEDTGLNYQDKNDFSTALIWFKDALETLKRVLPSEHPQIAQCLGRIGNLYKCMRQHDYALKYLCQELEMDEFCLPLDHVDVINDLTRIVEIYKLIGAYDQGLQFCQAKLATYTDILGESHPRSVNTLLNIASLHLMNNQLDDALNVCKHTLSIAKNVVPMDTHSAIECLKYMSNIYQIKEDLYQCLDCHQHQLELEKTIYSSKHCNIGWTLMCIGDVYYKLGYYIASLTTLKEAMAIYEEMSPRNDDNLHAIEQKINLAKRKQSFQTKPLEWKPAKRTPRHRLKSRSQSTSNSRSSSGFRSSD